MTLNRGRRNVVRRIQAPTLVHDHFSYLTPSPDDMQIKGLTFATATAEDKARTRASWGAKEVLASAGILACILFAYLYFRG